MLRNEITQTGIVLIDAEKSFLNHNILLFGQNLTSLNQRRGMLYFQCLI